MPVREVGIGHRTDADGIHWIANVEEKAVTRACAASETDRRVDSDVVALCWPRIRAHRKLGVRPCNETRKSGAQCGAVRGRGCTGAIPRFDDAVQKRFDELLFECSLTTRPGAGEPAGGLSLSECLSLRGEI